MYEERERIRVRQPAVRYTQKSKQTNVPVCLCMYVCMRSESESASHSSPPQLKGVRVISACVCTRCVCWYYFANLSTVSVCLPVHTVTQKNTNTHKQQPQKTSKYMSSNERENPSFVLNGGNTITHPPKHTNQGTHSIFDMPWKTSGGTDVIPLPQRSSVPPCVGQEPVRTSCALASSPLKVQPP